MPLQAEAFATPRALTPNMNSAHALKNRGEARQSIFEYIEI